MVHVQNTQGKKATEGESIRISPKKSSERSNRNDEEVSTRLSWLNGAWMAASEWFSAILIVLLSYIWYGM